MSFLNAIFAKIAGFLPAALSNLIGPDKVLHIAGGIFFGFVGAILGVVLGLNPLICGIGLAVVAGVAKEGLDYVKNQRAVAAGQSKPHGVEFLDAFYTGLGGVPPALVVWAIAYYGSIAPMVSTFSG